MRCRRDPCGAVDIESDVAVLMPIRLARVEAHPDADGDATRPVMVRERMLGGDGAGDGVGGRLEDNEKAVTFGPHLLAVALGEHAAQESPLGRKSLAVAITDTPQQRRRPLDVTEEQRHGPRRQLGHASII